VIFCCGSNTLEDRWFVFIVYILSRVVYKLFFLPTIGTVDKHLDLAFFGSDHHRLATHAAHHVKWVHRPAPKRQLQSVFLHALFQRLFQIVGDLEKPVGRTQPADALVRPLVVVIFDPEGAPLHSLFEAVKLHPLKKLVENGFPEPLDLTQRHGVVGLGPDVLDPVFFHLFLKPRLPTPVGVLPAVVGEHLPRHPIIGYRSTIGLQNVLGRLAAVQTQPGNVTAVVVQIPDQVCVAPPKTQGHDVALPQLVGTRSLEKTRLGWVLDRLAPRLFRQPFAGKCLVHGRCADTHQEKPLENVADSPRSVFGMGGFQIHDPLLDLSSYPCLAADMAFDLQPFGTQLPVGFDPALDRLHTDPELLTQQGGTVTLLQEKPHHSQPKLERVGPGPETLLRTNRAGLPFCLHGIHSFLCNWFLHSGVSPNFLGSAVS
jgi:hypothetical protein